MRAFTLGIIIFLSSQVQAECTLNLAKATGHYLLELEKADMQIYQGDPCTVLNSEYKKCSEKQLVELHRAINIREVLGNICMPHLPVDR